MVLIPLPAFAATVQVKPMLINAHGGTATGKDLLVCVVQGPWQECAPDMPTFTLPGAGQFEVQFKPPAGYSYEANYRCPQGSTFDYKQQKEVCVGEPDRTVTCSGSIGANEDKKCYVRYSDDAAVSSAPAPVVAPSPQPTPVPVTSPVTSTAPKSGLTLAQCDAILGLLRAFGVGEVVINTVSGILK